MVKIVKYIVFCVYRRSYLIGPPVILHIPEVESTPKREYNKSGPKMLGINITGDHIK